MKIRRNRRNIISILLILFCGGLQAQGIVGKWKTIDDETGKERSIIEIYQRGDEYFGKIVKIFEEPGVPPNPICEECEDERQGEPILGMEIIKYLTFDPKDKVYEDGEILDPENGNIYDCKLWIDEGNLKVRGYLYFVYRTQIWLPLEG